MHIGNNGFSWSSAISGFDGMYLGFDSAVIYPSCASSRAGGLQLRCLSE
ncbi:hypothetical protein [uncultured Rikenella sp.]|nr:hypothetical protein [uncultured Rikenella sp.]